MSTFPFEEYADAVRRDWPPEAHEAYAALLEHFEKKLRACDRIRLDDLAAELGVELDAVVRPSPES